jgi:hypothetical protein
MESLKELAIDAVILVVTLFAVTAGGMAQHARGLSCGGQVQTSSQAKP